MKTTYLNLGGTIRSCNPTQTLARVKPLLINLGITRLANVSGLDTIGIPTYVCIRPNAKHLSVSQGKGVTPELAQASAVMESIESYHAENVPPPSLFGSFASLRATYAVIDPQVFGTGFFSQQNIHDKEMQWVEAVNLCDKNKCFLPYALVSLNSSILRQMHGLFTVNSNGLASGNTRDEAICHALFEVIERDSLAKWELLDDAQRQAASVDIESIENKALQDIIAKFHNAKMELKIWDVTGPLGIPSFNCAIHEINDLRNLGVFTGSGAHLSREIALSRALTEVAQSRLTYISGSRDDIFPERYFMRAGENRAFIAEFNKPSFKKFNDCSAPDYDKNFAQNIDYVIAVLRANGYDDIYMFDHTKPEFDIPVVQVFIGNKRNDKCNV